MNSYKNNGPLDENGPNYLVVNGGYVYTGEKFTATDEDVEFLKGRFDITEYKTEHEDVVSTPDPEPFSVTDPVPNASNEDLSEEDFETEEDAIDSASDNSSNKKGVK